MKKIKKILLIIVISFLGLTILFNPTIKDCKEHVGFNDKFQVIIRENNFFIYSEYYVYTSTKVLEYDYYKNKKQYELDGQVYSPYIRKRYIGFMKNFW